MKEYIQQNFAIILAFLLPIVLIVAVALSTYIPSKMLSTKYNFIYTSCTDGRTYYPYNCEEYLHRKYSVVDGVATLNPTIMTEDLNKDGVPDFKELYSDRIFLHDTQNNESREITVEEAKKLTLNSLLTSPDGVNVSGYYSGYRGDFIFGGGSTSYGYYLMKGKAKSKLHLLSNSDQYYYQNNFQFLGWVLPGRN